MRSKRTETKSTPAAPRARIHSVRGIVFARNARGRALSTTDLERWLRLNRTVFKCPKIDVLANGDDIKLFAKLSAAASSLDLPLSLRTDCAALPQDIESFKSTLWDIFLCPVDATDTVGIQKWLETCHAAKIPVRVQLTAPFDAEFDISAWAERLAHCSSVNIAASDPFVAAPSARNDIHTAMTIQKAVELAHKLIARGVEVNLLRFPFCVVPEDLRPNIVNAAQFALDHQQYQREAYELAQSLYRRHPVIIKQTILIKLGQFTSTNNPIDRALLPWIMDAPWIRARVWAFHKLARHRKTASPSSPADAELAVERLHAETRRARGAICGACSLQRICDGYAHLADRLPGLTVTTQPGEIVVNALEFANAQFKHFDAIDAARNTVDDSTTVLAQRANAVVLNSAPSREVDSFDYRVDGTWSWQLPGSLRWFSFVGGEKLSTPLARLDPPFTLSTTFGGGIADYIGFAIGRSCRLLCPMTAYTHRIVLHVEADGSYVLLRDGVAVRPSEFVGKYYAPTRLGTGLEPRIAIWNIDGTIGTQAVYIWQHGAASAVERTFRVSIVVVSTRYSRRLQACLNMIAHQQGLSLTDIEVIVAFVPGLDATNDVIDSIQLAHPELTIVPTPFNESNANAKGLMLNECLDKARGEWVMVLDADILLAPGMLARLAALPETCKFAIPDGRKMLSRETTARVLLGEIAPWNAWDDLINSAGEYRMREADGVPVGYCQCVRRECLEKVRYEEMHHFEGADWKFGKDMRDHFGAEHRLSGTPVLHLDHGSSNWYGASRQY